MKHATEKIQPRITRITGISFRLSVKSVVKFGLALLFCLGLPSAPSAEVMPPAPRQYFNDYASVVSAATAARLNQTLEDFERQTSSQILVAIYSRMQSDSSIEDYTVRVAQAWKAGRQGTNNGAVLFVFTQDRKMYLQVGYGLEGTLPDALAKQIIENEITPRLKQGDFDGGLSAGVSAILAATRGEYKGTSRTVADRGHSSGVGTITLIVFVIIVLILFTRVLRGLGGAVYGRRGYYSSWGGGISGGGWGGGGGGSGGGGFSGGGGSFGGGGAGGSW